MSATLGRWGSDVERDAAPMSWMEGHPAGTDMPGMATPEQLDQLREANGDEAAALFLQMMSRHHAGGADMAADAADNAADGTVRGWARAMARNQRIEIAEDEATRQRLALPAAEATGGQATAPDHHGGN